MIVFCDDHTCKHNDGTACRAPNISIVLSAGIREDGACGAINVCNDYEVKEDECDDV
jgi:hypothetical protein